MPYVGKRCGAPLNVALTHQLYLQKYVPLDLRPKKTRAIRKRMTKHQVSCYMHVALIACGDLIAVKPLVGCYLTVATAHLQIDCHASSPGA